MSLTIAWQSGEQEWQIEESILLVAVRTTERLKGQDPDRLPASLTREGAKEIPSSQLRLTVAY